SVTISGADTLHIVNTTISNNTAEFMGISGGAAGLSVSMNGNSDSLLIFNSVIAYNKYFDPITDDYIVGEVDQIIFGTGRGVVLNTYSNSKLFEDNNKIKRSSGNVASDKNPFVNVVSDNYALSNFSNAIGSGKASISFDGVTVNAPMKDVFAANRPNPASTPPDMGAIENSLGERLNTIYTVRQDGTGDYTTIQAGIDGVIDGDTVLVQPGTYVENINYNEKNIVVSSLYLTMGDTSYISNTIIDGNQSGSVVNISNTDSNAEFVGMTVQNGSSTNGGGIITGGTNGSKIIRTIIRNNTASSGAGVYGGGSPIFENVEIIYNVATGNYGSGIYFTDGSPVFINSKIGYNTGAAYGGGVALFDSDPVFTNVLINNNSSDKGGGLLCEYSSDPVLTNVTIINNSASQGGSSLYSRADASITVKNSIIWSNDNSEIVTETGGSASITYSSIHESYTGTGNIDSDPLFVDAINRDYRLSDYSPAIGAGTDAGAPTTDIEGNPRPNPAGSNPDMGAYESSLGAPAHNRFIYVATTGEDVGSVGVM
ncbi:MAG: choice-of-anchor Q domain-containing protein, partial [Pseudomonadales bacterium]